MILVAFVGSYCCDDTNYTMRAIGDTLVLVCESCGRAETAECSKVLLQSSASQVLLARVRGQFDFTPYVAKQEEE